MIVVDTSAVFAIAAREQERDAFVDALDRTDSAICSSVTYLEMIMVLTGRSRAIAKSTVDDLLRTFAIDVAAVDRGLTDAAVDAFDRFGKGRHRASLNLADCFSYALAKSRNAPLLFKGDDFSRTDIAAAWQA
ncbi:MAG: ribonuclease VapC [Alphaproteobacteria bacterium]|jgi:ribonuclease VapC|nr:ribonuclease VapC [Alphaproteobacteria bacterium]MEA3027995.1 ribonuclease VapC [Alphaproteobacteria bacterium]